jgi:hypothetical protein
MPAATSRSPASHKQTLLFWGKDGVLPLHDEGKLITSSRTDYRVPYLSPLTSHSEANILRHWPLENDAPQVHTPENLGLHEQHRERRLSPPSRRPPATSRREKEHPQAPRVLDPSGSIRSAYAPCARNPQWVKLDFFRPPSPWLDADWLHSGSFASAQSSSSP